MSFEPPPWYFYKCSDLSDHKKLPLDTDMFMCLPKSQIGSSSWHKPVCGHEAPQFKEVSQKWAFCLHCKASLPKQSLWLPVQPVQWYQSQPSPGNTCMGADPAKCWALLCRLQAYSVQQLDGSGFQVTSIPKALQRTRTPKLGLGKHILIAWNIK